MKEAIVAVGEACEVAGILLVGSPELTVYGKRARGTVRRWLEVAIARLVQWIGWELRPRYGLLLSDHAAPRDWPPLEPDPSTAGSSVVEQLDFLMQFAVAVRERLAEIEQRYENKTVWLTNRANELASSLSQEITQSLEAERRLFLPQRAAGIPLLIVGSVLLGVANFLSN